MTTYHKKLPSQRIGMKIHHWIGNVVYGFLVFCSDILVGDKQGERQERTGEHFYQKYPNWPQPEPVKEE